MTAVFKLFFWTSLIGFFFGIMLWFLFIWISGIEEHCGEINDMVDTTPYDEEDYRI